VDFGAHLFGLLVGGILGSLIASALTHPPGPLVQWSLAATALGSILTCWLLALS